MISIILFHQYFISLFPFNLFHNYGYWGVEVFLFLSGMGLVKSIESNSITNYYKRRFTRIIPSCIICGTSKYTAFLLLGSSAEILKEGLNIGPWSVLSLDLWFIYTIIILYIISPILYHALKRRPLNTLICIILIFGINGFTLKPHVGYDWLSVEGVFAWTIDRLPIFTLGMFFSINSDDLDRKIVYSIPFLMIAILLVLLGKTNYQICNIQVFITFTLFLGVPSLTSILICFLKKTPLSWQKPIKFFGSYSLELYLVHEFIFWTIKIYFDGSNPWLLLSVSVILSCIIAYSCHLLSDKCKALINN